MINFSRRNALKATAGAGALAAFGCQNGNNAPSSTQDLAAMDAVATAQAIKNGNVSTKEVIDAAIDRAERANPRINAIVTPYFDSARERADSSSDAPWAGVPTFIKDLDDIIGQRTTYGARAFMNYIAPKQAPYFDQIFASGMISLGKSATPEFGLSATTESLSSGAARNPWNTDYSTGGSSGGAAALVAAGVVPVAHASDGGGSIRIPASCCGVVGLKPSRNSMRDHGRVAGRPLHISEHLCESRTVRDTAAFLAMLEQPREDATGLVAGPVSARKKIGFFTKAPSGIAVDAEVVAAITATAATLEELGHQVEEVDPPFGSGMLQDFTVYWGAGAAEAVANWENLSGRKADYRSFEPWTYGLIDYFEARRHTLETVLGRLIGFEKIYGAAFSDCDLLLSPVLATPPPKLGALSPDNVFPVNFDRMTEYVCFTPYANVGGGPAISLPAGMSAGGLPIGAHIAAPIGQERAILEVAYELEEATPWRDLRPAEA